MYTCLILMIAAVPSQVPPVSPPKVSVVTKPELTKPTEQAARVGELVRLLSSSPKGRWELSPDSLGADLEPGGEGKAFFSAERPGRYLLVNYVGESPAAWVVITVGGVRPPEPIPPKPIPPEPTPPPKPAPSALVKRLTDAIDRDGGLNDPNRQAITLLQALAVEAKEYASKAEIKTANDFVSLVAKASKAISKDAIPETRKLLLSELRTLLGDSDFALTEAKRDEIRQAMTRLENAISEVLK